MRVDKRKTFSWLGLTKTYYSERVEYEVEKVVGILKDYDFQLSYHLGKANVVVDALSRKSLHMSALMVKNLELVKQFQDLTLVSGLTPGCVKLGMLKLTSNILEEIKNG